MLSSGVPSLLLIVRVKPSVPGSATSPVKVALSFSLIVVGLIWTLLTVGATLAMVTAIESMLLLAPSSSATCTLTVELAQDLAANDVDVTLFADLKVARTVTVRNDNSAGVSSTNPNYTATMTLKEYNPIGASIGELAITRAVYMAGSALSRAEA